MTRRGGEEPSAAGWPFGWEEEGASRKRMLKCEC